MNKDCKNTENAILQEKTDTVVEHIRNCEKCDQFLKTHKRLHSLSPNMLKAPKELEFDAIWEKRISTNNIAYFKWGSFVAVAAVFILVIYLPVSYFNYSKNSMNNNTYALLDTKIVEELDTLESDMFDMENNLTDVLIDMELEDIGTSINNFV